MPSVLDHRLRGDDCLLGVLAASVQVLSEDPQSPLGKLLERQNMSAVIRSLSVVVILCTSGVQHIVVPYCYMVMCVRLPAATVAVVELFSNTLSCCTERSPYFVQGFVLDCGIPCFMSRSPTYTAATLAYIANILPT